MSFKRESGYELKFINQCEFEIFCLDCNDNFYLKLRLERTKFVENIASEEVIHNKYLKKITGKTFFRNELVTFLDNVFKKLNEPTLETYKDF